MKNNSTEQEMTETANTCKAALQAIAVRYGLDNAEEHNFLRALFRKVAKTAAQESCDMTMRNIEEELEQKVAAALVSQIVPMITGAMERERARCAAVVRILSPEAAQKIACMENVPVEGFVFTTDNPMPMTKGSSGN